MKTTLILKSAIVALFILCAFNKAKAQFSSYPVRNTTSCTYKIGYEFYDSTCTLINSGTTSVPPSGIILTPTIPATDVKIVVLAMTAPACSITQSPSVAGANVVCPTSTSASLSSAGCGCAVSSLNVSTSGAVIN